MQDNFASNDPSACRGIGLGGLYYGQNGVYGVDRGVVWRWVNGDVYETQHLAQVSPGTGFAMGESVGAKRAVLTFYNAGL